MFRLLQRKKGHPKFYPMIAEKIFILLLKLTSKLTPQRGMAIARLCSAFAFLLNTRLRQITERNLRLCFDNLSNKELKDLVRESLANSFYLFFEYAYMSNWEHHKLLGLCKQVEGLDLLDEALSKQKGVLLLVPHFGNFEIFEVFLASYYSFVALYNPPKLKSLDLAVSNMRERHGGSMHPIGPTGLRAIIKALKNGRISALLPDQVPSLESGAIQSEFFGNNIRYMSLIYKLLKLTPSEVLIGSVTRRLEKGTLEYELCFEKPDDLVYSEKKGEHIRAVTDAIERVVVRSPKQYQWEYKIFKNRQDFDPYQDT